MISLVVMSALLLGSASPSSHLQTLDMSRWKPIPSESGPKNYYQLVTTPIEQFLHAAYEPPWETTVMGISFTGEPHRARLRWRWRALTLPKGGNECVRGKADSAGLLYAAWRRGLKWYVLKFVWSSTVPKGTRCAHQENPFKAEETVVLESGPAQLNRWIEEEVDLDAEFRRAFAGGNPKAEVPPLKGLALLTDGDQTHSQSAADWADFALLLP